MQEKRRVVITGLGLVSPLGCELETVWARLLAGTSGVRAVRQFDASPYSSRIAAEVIEFDIDRFVDKKEARRMDPFCHFGMGAARLAVEDAGLKPESVDGDRAGVIVGSGIGGLHICQEQGMNFALVGPRKFSPFQIPQMIVDILAGMIAIEYGFRGPNFSITSACATAAHCIGESTRMIQHDEADLILAGGAEAAINDLGLGGFAKMRALSSARNDDPEKASRPFDAQRDGFVIGEGAAVVVLEEYNHAVARGARIYCEVAGYGRTADAYHITAPDSEGRGAARAISLAMKDAGVSPAEIDYINAHGTSTPLNDKGETLAIKTALGQEDAYRVAISSTKSMTGHLLGAAAGLETIVCALAMRDGIIPPTINYEFPDPDCDLNYTPNIARRMPVRVCLNNSLGFGGHNASLCLRAI
jgi:3-oxoacyl-[acyl-carrier-protein] synthase II